VEKAVQAAEKPRRAKPGKAKPQGDLGDFGEEWLGRVMEFLVISQRLTGRVVDCKKYWVKVETPEGLIYINKGYIVTAKPSQLP
jgi:hypothetical protein